MPRGLFHNMDQPKEEERVYQEYRTNGGVWGKGTTLFLRFGAPTGEGNMVRLAIKTNFA